MWTAAYLLHAVAHSSNPWLETLYSLVPFFLIIGAIALVYRISERRDAGAPPDAAARDDRHGDEPV